MTNLTELAEAVEAGVDRVMLDNMKLSEVRAAVKKNSARRWSWKSPAGSMKSPR